MSDKVVPYFYDNCMIYDESTPYYQVWIDGINKFSPDYFIYLQEDFILYDSVDDDAIDRYVSFLEENKDYSFVRLLRVDSFKGKKIEGNLYEVEPSNKNVFAMQPTIWRSSDYIRLLEATKEPKWLETPNYRNQMIKMGMKGAYHYDGEKKGGSHHYNSNVYPYIATAIIKGKWNLKEYNEELMQMFEEYHIDPLIRGNNL